MSRSLYVLGWGYVLLCAMLLWSRPMPEPVPVPVSDPNGPRLIEAPPPPMPASAASAWFASVKPYCNPLEVEVHLRRSPPPGGREGAGFAAACWAVAGKIDRARATIDALPVEDRQHAASIVFGIGHPIADMGDDLSAGPIMELVVEYQPQNYMALYHAGMSYHALGRSEQAKRHLTEFLRLYNVNDGWKTSAEDVLRRLGEKR